MPKETVKTLKGWTKLQNYTQKLLEASHKMGGLESALAIWDKRYTQNYWYEGFAAPKFRVSHKSEFGERIKDFLNLISEVKQVVTELLPEYPQLKKIKKQLSISKQFGLSVQADFEAIVSLVSGKGASDPEDAHLPDAADKYKSLTSMLSSKEKGLIDDWRAGVKRLSSDLEMLHLRVADNVKRQQLQDRSMERRKMREQSKEEIEDFVPEKGKRYTFEEILHRHRDVEEKRQKVREFLDGDELAHLDEDIDKIEEMSEESGKLLTKKPFGFAVAPIVATNSFISNVGMIHLKKHKIIAEWVANSYILIRNAPVLGWRADLSTKKQKFDPIFVLRRIKKRMAKKKPGIKYVRDDYQIWSEPIRRGDYYYVVVLPSMKGHAVGLREDKDITIRTWQFADTTRS